MDVAPYRVIWRRNCRGRVADPRARIAEWSRAASPAGYEALSAAMERTSPYASPAWANPLTTRPPWTAWISKTYHGLGASGTRNEREDPVRGPASTTLLSASRISYTKEGLGVPGGPGNRAV